MSGSVLSVNALRHGKTKWIYCAEFASSIYIVNYIIYNNYYINPLDFDVVLSITMNTERRQTNETLDH